ncbi:MAG TPA: hypothetical protein ENG63_00395 [Candidatus Desulfofervidus auxilii]|uniref:Uncharacterized protein n=1 Tax=Desulfofervidus auxilii TaxID=1621989 RepID=A0A7C0Y194_DESA2|nr:hypothetical protein [Candidatus Desulfofervidus auxilii]
MEKETERFLQAEETAAKLVETLKQLHTEATSYQTATKELDVVRQRLLKLIESTEKIATNSHEVIEILKKIGGPEILDRLLKIEKISTENFDNQLKSLDALKKLISEKFNNQLDSLNELKKLINEKFDNQSKFLDELKKLINEKFNNQSDSLVGLKKLIIVTLTSSITAIIIGIIALLR